MNKRFNIRAAFEEAKEAAEVAKLEVDKEASMTPEEKAIRDSALQLAATKEKTDEKLEDSETPKEDEDAVETNQTDEDSTPKDVQEEEPVDPETEAIDSKDDTIEESPEESTDKTDDDKNSGKEEDVDKDETPPPEPDSQEAKEDSKNTEEEKTQEKDAVDVVTSLESIANIIEKSLDKGGLTPMSAAATSIVLEQLYNRVGLTYKPTTFPAMESYESVSSRRRNTQIALEGVTGAIEAIWVAIKKAISRTLIKIKKMARAFAYHFRGLDGQIKVIRKIITEATKNTTDKKYNFPSYTRHLMYGEEFDPTSVNKEVGLLSDVLKSRFIPDGLKELKTISGILKMDKSNIEIKSIPQIFFDVKSFYPLQTKIKSSNSNVNVFVSEKPFLGRYSFEATFPKRNLDTEQFQLGLVSSNVVFELVDQYEKAYEVEFLELNKISHFLDTVQQSVNKMHQYWNSFESFETEYYNIENALDTSSSIGRVVTADKNTTGKIIGSIIDAGIEHVRNKMNSSIKKQVILSISAINRTYIDYSIAASEIVYATASASVHYANASARAYS